MCRVVRLLSVRLSPLWHQPSCPTDSAIIFLKGTWRVLVERAKVVVSRHEGAAGGTSGARKKPRGGRYYPAGSQQG